MLTVNFISRSGRASLASSSGTGDYGWGTCAHFQTSELNHVQRSSGYWGFVTDDRPQFPVGENLTVLGWGGGERQLPTGGS